jgi:hypothetical protein
MSKPNAAQAPETGEERRQFLERIGKYAAVTPPAVPAYAQGSSGHTSTPEPSVTPSTSAAPAHSYRQSNPSGDDRGRAEAADQS